MTNNITYKLSYTIGSNTFTHSATPVDEAFSIAKMWDNYKYRLSFETEFQFKNDPKTGVYDYTNLKGVETDNPFSRITIICYKSGVEFARGFFSIADCKIDDDICTITVTPGVYDDYNCIFENWEREYNIITEVAQADEIRLLNSINIETEEFTGFVYSQYDNVNHPANCYHPLLFYGYQLFYKHPRTQGFAIISVGNLPYSVPIKTKLEFVSYDGLQNEVKYKVTTTWGRESAITYDDPITGPVPPAGSGWVQISSIGYLGLPATKWARYPYYNIFPYYNYIETVNSCGVEFEYELLNPYTSNTAYYDNLYRGRKLMDVLEYLLTQAGCNLTIESIFFNDTVNPVTNEPNCSYMLFNSSDIKSYTISSEAATLQLLSLKKLLDNLTTLFNLAWIIKDGKFIIEHISYFANGETYQGNNIVYKDLRGIVSPHTNLPEIYKSNKYEYLKNLARSERWTQGQYLDFDFSPLQIDYEMANITTDNVKPYNIDFITDVAGCISEPNNFGNFEIVMCAYRNLPTDINLANYADIVINETGYRSEEDVTNGYLCLSNLFDRFWRNERIQLTGEVAGDQEQMITTINKKIQTIEVTDCDMELLDYSHARTNLGIGIIKSAVHNVPKQTTDLRIEI